MYVQPLRSADPSIVPRDRLSLFITDVYHNFGALHSHHRKLLDRLHAIQREEHPVLNSVTAAIFDAALNWREEYMEYITNYPIAEYRIVDEMANNITFKEFVEVRLWSMVCVHHGYSLTMIHSNAHAIRTQTAST